jgi:cysteine desulfuration protein SufE
MFAFIQPQHPESQTDSPSGGSPSEQRFSPEGGKAVVPSMAEQEEELVEAFDLFDDPMDRYAYLIDLGKALPTFSPDRQSDEKLVPGCQSKVWLEVEAMPESTDAEKGPRMRIEADSNTVITKGIVSILVRVLSGQHARDILEAELAVIDRIDLRAHLSSQRANGLASMIQRIKSAAHAALPNAS